MAKDALTDYSTTNSSNTDVGGVAIQGTNNISNFDNGLRELMTHLAEAMNGTSPLSDGLKIGYASDLTANIQFDCSAITTGTTRTVTWPDADVTIPSGTIADTATAQTFTNKSLSDSTTYFVDNADATKKLQFQCSGITTATTRTVTWPDLTGTVVLSTTASLSGYSWLVDEDDMASDSAVLVPSQQSVKAYVDTLSTLATAQATTSGTAIDFTSIPAGTNWIEVIFNAVSLSGTDNILVQIGDSGGVETTGYVSSALQVTAGTTSTGASSTSGFIVRASGASIEVSGVMILRRVSGNIWVSSVSAKTSTTTGSYGGGDKTLSAELDRVRITVTGSDTFDSGSATIRYGA